MDFLRQGKTIHVGHLHVENGYVELATLADPFQGFER